MRLKQWQMPKEAAHRIALWEREECYSYFIEQRRSTCNFMQRLELSLAVPYCSRCADLVNPFACRRPPDISPGTWKSDLEWLVGTETIRVIKKELRKDSQFAILCKR